jgi:hypothetical protein
MQAEFSMDDKYVDAARLREEEAEEDRQIH